jgi:hypothetical protein
MNNHSEGYKVQFEKITFSNTLYIFLRIHREKENVDFLYTESNFSDEDKPKVKNLVRLYLYKVT